MDQVAKFLVEQSDSAVHQLKELLLIPSISGDSAYRGDVQQCAEFLGGWFTSTGFDAQIIPTDGHPIVFASWLDAPGAPTVLVYGHYDVQPPDPLEEWTTPPFEPTIRDGRIYARGATDDKGQMFTHLLSAAAWLKVHGRLPVNVKFVIEGEEEVGSDNLDTFLAQNEELIACDVVVVSDTSQYAPGIPAITYGLRGILACEVKLTGPNCDLHSGVFGGSVANPANGLAKLVAALLDDDGRVRIPGFYDDVVPLTDRERTGFAELPFEEEAWLMELGVDAPFGETGYSTTERRWARPTCDVNGFVSGYTGEGPKTIVPGWALVKITCRLVPGQDEKKITAALEEYLRSLLPAGLKMEFTDQHGCGALVFPTESRWMHAAGNAIEQGFGRQPVFIREGGSIPVVATFRELLGVDTLLLGWGQNTDNLHSPNEHLRLDDFHRGTLASAHLWEELSQP